RRLCALISLSIRPTSPPGPYTLSLHDALPILDLNLTGCTSLVNISMNSALLGFVDLSTCSALTQASFNNNNLMGIEFGNNPVLSTLQLDNNQLFSIDVSEVPSLTSLSCQNNAISTADFSGSTFLQALAMQGNDLNTIDLSNSPNLVVLTLDNNPLLQTVFIKNGSNEDILTMTGSPVNFICADESQLVNVQAVAGPAVSVSSYCSFTPGGDYNTINGVITYDIDGNGCSDTDPVFPFVKIQLTGPGGDGASFITADGSYSFYTQDGNYSLAPAVENASYFNVLPPVAVGFPTVNN